MTGRFTDRYLIRLGVGLLWLVAGGLQLQPFMFTDGFADDVLGSAALSQPAPLGRVITTIQSAVAAHPSAWNWPFALVQLGIGAVMIIPRGRLLRLACLGSVAWGASVWLIGEGAGGLLTGHAASSTGAPGAALLYALLTVLAWPSEGPERPLSARWLGLSWSGVWLIGALLAALPSQWGPGGLEAQAAMGWMMEPSWFVAPAAAVMNWLGDLPVLAASTICIALLLAHLGIASAGWWRGRRGRWLVTAGGGLSIVFWAFAQGFGGLGSGTATDVGTAPLIVLLGWATWRSMAEPNATGLRDNDHEDTRNDRDRVHGSADPGRLQLVVEELDDHQFGRRAGQLVEQRAAGDRR